MGATVTEVESSHVPMLSKLDVVIEVIRKAAAVIAKEQGSVVKGREPFSTDRRKAVCSS